MSSKKVLVIGAGWEQYQLIKEIKDQGCFVIATHPFMNTDGFRLADVTFVKESDDIKSHLTIAETFNIDAVVSDNCDFSFYTASVVASKFGLPFAAIKEAVLCNDKLGQRTLCESGKPLQPKFSSVRHSEDLKLSSERIGYPSIIKPVDSRGTFGVTVVTNFEELQAAFYEALCYSPSKTLIHEQFIEGTLVTVDGFCFSNGHAAITVASREFESGSKPVTKNIIYPAQFSDDTNLKLMKNHEEVVKSLGYNYGHTHGEYIITQKEEIYLVECSNRGGGVYTSSVINPLLTELNLNQLLLNQSLGIDSFEYKSEGLKSMKKSVMLTFLDFKVGEVVKSFNYSKLLALPFTVRYRSIYGKNDMVESIDNCASRHSMLVIEGGSVNDTLKNLESFKSAINIEYY